MPKVKEKSMKHNPTISQYPSFFGGEIICQLTRDLNEILLSGQTIALFSPSSFSAIVYERVVHDQILDFKYDSATGKITDAQTGSEWNFEGKAIKGKMEGESLSRIPFDEGFWFSWAAFHPQTELYTN